MEIGNLFDNIIYRANIFNYDNSILVEFKEIHLKLDQYIKGIYFVTRQ